MTDTPEPGQRAHSELGASVAARFFACPGSVRLSRGLPNRSSVYAAQGTSAHALGELCLRNGQDTIEYIDRVIEGFVIDEATADNVQVYVDVCREHADSSDAFGIEQRFDLSKFDPPVPMFGTSDFWRRYRRADGKRVLRIVDYKNGWLAVAAANNPQLMYYALGAMFLDDSPVDEVEAIIVQRDQVKRTTFDPLELVEWSIVLIRKAHETQREDAPFAAGAWCRFCPASGQCAEQARSALATARIEFSALPAPAEDGGWTGRRCPKCGGSGEIEGEFGPKRCGGCGGTGEEYAVGKPAAPHVTGAPPDPKLLTPDALAVVLTQLDGLEIWIKAVRESATAAISRGEVVPGYKLVPTRPAAAWVSAEDAAMVLRALFEVDPHTREILTPAQARGRIITARYEEAKARGEKLTKKAIEAGVREEMKSLVTHRSSGLTLVSVSDTRDAAPRAGSEFGPVPENQGVDE